MAVTNAGNVSLYFMILTDDPSIDTGITQYIRYIRGQETEMPTLIALISRRGRLATGILLGTHALPNLHLTGQPYPGIQFGGATFIPCGGTLILEHQIISPQRDLIKLELGLGQLRANICISFSTEGRPTTQRTDGEEVVWKIYTNAQAIQAHPRSLGTRLEACISFSHTPPNTYILGIHPLRASQTLSAFFGAISTCSTYLCAYCLSVEGPLWKCFCNTRVYCSRTCRQQHTSHHHFCRALCDLQQ